MIILNKIQNEVKIALAILLLGASVGYNVPEHTNVITIDSDFDSYQDKTEELNLLIQDVILNPGNYDLGTVQDNIFHDYYPWAERHPDGRQETFVEYLEACNQIIIDLSNGEQVDTTEMNELYSKLIPTAPESKKTIAKLDTPFLWVAGVTLINT